MNCELYPTVRSPSHSKTIFHDEAVIINGLRQVMLLTHTTQTN